MKKAVDLLEKTEALVMVTFSGGENSEECNEIINCLNDAMALLKAPCWETPEQYRKRTGEDWPDDWAVCTRGNL